MAILPNADRAIIPLAKLRDYALDPHHPIGRHKARAFQSRLGFHRDDFEALILAMRRGIAEHDAHLHRRDALGRHFRVEFEVGGPAGSARIVTGWIYEGNEDAPPLTTLFVR